MFSLAQSLKQLRASVVPSACLLVAAVGFPAAAQLLPPEVAIYSQFRADPNFDLSSNPEPNDRIGSDFAVGDFDNDGFPELAIGCALEDLGLDYVNSGWVSVVDGSPSGPDASAPLDIWDQQGDIAGLEESGDTVGFSTAAGDFNGDTFMDLVMGSPGEAIGSETRAGSINVIYGAAGGLQEAGNRQFYQRLEIGGNSVPGASEAGDQFGYSLAVGDFNGDNMDDLAIGVPDEDLGSNPAIVNAGAIVVLYGRPVIGLDPQNAQGINRDWAGMLESPGAGDSFGWSLAAGDFNGDTIDDLAVGVPEDSRATTNAGSVDVIYGSDDGLDTTTNEVWTLDSPDVAGDAEVNDAFGWSLAVGNFNGDSFDDLAIGIPDRATTEMNSTISEHGAASVLYGTGSGLSGLGSLYLEQGMDGIDSFNENGDSFGEDVAAGDVNGDGYDELLVGIPGERVFFGPSGRDGAGAALLVRGTMTGLTTSGAEFFDYNRVGAPATGDALAHRVALGDFDADGKDDVVLAVPGRAVYTQAGDLISSAGEVLVLPSGWIFADGFESGDLTEWSQASP